MKKKSVLVTGGTSGIGKETCRVFLENDWIVHATGSRIETVQDTLLEFGKQDHFFLYPVELQDTSAIYSLFESLPAIDVLINNAGIYENSDWELCNEAQFEQMFSINTKSMWLFSSLAARNMKKHNTSGLILNNASTLGRKPAKNTAVYSASKAAMLSLSQSLALDLAPRIRSNAILPGVVNTPIHKSEHASDFLNFIAGLNPLQRVGNAKEIAKILYRLSTDEFSWMTGSEIIIDGGISLVC